MSCQLMRFDLRTRYLKIVTHHIEYHFIANIFTYFEAKVVRAVLILE